MTDIEKIFFWLTVFLFAISFAVYLSDLVLKQQKKSKVGYWLLVIGTISVTTVIALRWQATGHLPTVDNYENALAGTWVISLFTLVLVTRAKNMQYVSIGTLAVCLVMLGCGYLSKPSLKPMNVTLYSEWLFVHIFFAWLSYASYVIAFGVAIVYLLKSSMESKGNVPGVLEKMPSLITLEDYMFRYIVFGFIMDAVMLASGSIWAKQLWGSYWAWDPVETWALLSWLLYGLLIHLKVSIGWNGKKLAWMTITALLTVIIAFWGVNFLTDKSIHVFTMTQ